jgi:hypothetical protein
VGGFDWSHFVIEKLPYRATRPANSDIDNANLLEPWKPERSQYSRQERIPLVHTVHVNNKGRAARTSSVPYSVHVNSVNSAYISNTHCQKCTSLYNRRIRDSEHLRSWLCAPIAPRAAVGLCKRAFEKLSRSHLPGGLDTNHCRTGTHLIISLVVFVVQSSPERKGATLWNWYVTSSSLQLPPDL